MAGSFKIEKDDPVLKYFARTVAGIATMFFASLTLEWLRKKPVPKSVVQGDPVVEAFQRMKDE